MVLLFERVIFCLDIIWSTGPGVCESVWCCRSIYIHEKQETQSLSVELKYIIILLKQTHTKSCASEFRLTLLFAPGWMCKSSYLFLPLNDFSFGGARLHRESAVCSVIITNSAKLSRNSSLRFKLYHDADITSVSFPRVWRVNRSPMCVIWACVGCTRARVKFGCSAQLEL